MHLHYTTINFIEYNDIQMNEKLYIYVTVVYKYYYNI